MRRRRREPEAPNGSRIPVSVLVFVPADWPGDDRGGIHDVWARYEAWDEARTAWAEANLPDGVEDLPAFDGDVPEAPFAPSMI